MKVTTSLLPCLLLLILACQKDPYSFEYEKTYLSGLEISKKNNKPIFLYFTSFLSSNDEFYHGLIQKRSIRKKLETDFVTVILYTDDKTAISELDTLNLQKLKFSKKGRINLAKARNIGQVNATIETDFFKRNNQPLYVIINEANEILVQPFGYTSKNTTYFLTKLEEGLASFRNQNH